MFDKVLVFQNPGAFKGVMQKVNPFRSASQVGTPPSSLRRCVSVTDAGPLFLTQVSKSQSSESLEQGGASVSNQVGETPTSLHQTLDSELTTPFISEPRNVERRDAEGQPVQVHLTGTWFCSQRCQVMLGDSNYGGCLTVGGGRPCPSEPYPQPSSSSDPLL